MTIRSDNYYTGNPCVAVITALMNEINPIWTKRLDGLDFVYISQKA